MRTLVVLLSRLSLAISAAWRLLLPRVSDLLRIALIPPFNSLSALHDPYSTSVLVLHPGRQAANPLRIRVILSTGLALRPLTLSINVERGHSPFGVTVPYCHSPFPISDEPSPSGYLESAIFSRILHTLDVGTVNAQAGSRVSNPSSITLRRQ